MCMKKIYIISFLFIASCASTPEQLQAKASKQSDIELCFDLTYEPSEYVRQELANRRVDCNLPSLKARVAEKRQKQIAMGQALIALGGSLQSTNTEIKHIEPVKMTYYLQNHYVTGNNMICIYKNGGQTATHTVRSSDICPINKQF